MIKCMIVNCDREPDVRIFDTRMGTFLFCQYHFDKSKEHRRQQNMNCDRCTHKRYEHNRGIMPCKWIITSYGGMWCYCERFEPAANDSDPYSNNELGEWRFRAK